MKKIFLYSLFLLLVCVFALSACDNGNTISNNNKGNDQQATEENGENNSGGENSNISVVCLHSFGDWNTVKQATCIEEGKLVRTCSKCFETEESTVSKNDMHTEVIDVAVPATCTVDGLTEGKHCSVCNTVTMSQNVVKAKGHIEVIDKAVTATCTTDGLTEGKHCSICSTTIVEQTTVKAKGHTEVIDIAVAPTCTETGLTEGKHCSECHTIIIAPGVVNASGHDEVSHDAKHPTCTEIGWDEYVTCSRCDYTTFSEKPAGHSMEGDMCIRCMYPYTTIYSVEDLKNISSNLNGKYVLMRDIDLGGLEWTPIGTENSPFQGEFNGNGYVVSNFKITSSQDYAGLFGYNKGIVKNLGVEGFNIDLPGYAGGYKSAGGLIGRNLGTVTDCYSTGNVKSSRYVGGLVGSNTGTITNCYATGTSSCYSGNGYLGSAGGLVGCNHDGGIIIDCRATGNVVCVGRGGVGGLVGYNWVGTITNCYATGDISASSSGYSGDSSAGGLVGDNINNGLGNSVITNCYSTGNVTSSSISTQYESNSYAGGLIGNNSGEIKNCYATGNISASSSGSSGDNYSGGLVGRHYWPGVITNCWSTGNVSSTFSPGISNGVGGLVGYNSSATINNSYRCNTQSFSVTENESEKSEATDNNGIVKTTTELQSVSFYSSTLGWDDEIWNFSEGEYPTLK